MRLPTPPEIAEAPELAALGSADHVLELMCRSLIAANPELVEQQPRGTEAPPRLLARARDIMRLAAALERSIECYLRQLDRDRTTEPGNVSF